MKTARIQKQRKRKSIYTRCKTKNQTKRIPRGRERKSQVPETPTRRKKRSRNQRRKEDRKKTEKKRRRR